jgi:hypothetical protein
MNGSRPDDDFLIDGMGELPGGAFREAEAPAALRESILLRTTTALRSRARRRKALILASWLIAYAAGAATVLTAFRPWTGPEGGGAAPVAAPGPGPSAEKAPAVKAPAEPDPRSLVRKARRAPPAERYRLLKGAGDRFLNGFGDIESALDCYRKALDLAVRAGPVRSEPGDSWLFSALVQSRI